MDTAPGYVQECDGSFYTWTFIIRYCDEEIELNDLCNFQAEVEVDIDWDYIKTEFFLEVELYFVDMAKLQSKGINEQISEVNAARPLKKVSSLDFKILNVM